METNANQILDANRNPMPVVGYALARTVTATTSQRVAPLSTTEQKIVTFFALDDRIWVIVGPDEDLTAAADANDCIPIEAGKDQTLPIPAGSGWAVIGGKYTYGVAQ